MDLFYKFKHNKFYFGIIEFSPNNYDENIGFNIGYQYYILEKRKGASYFLVANGIYIVTNESYKSDFNELIGGCGAERKILKWLMASCYLGAGVEIHNVQYPKQLILSAGTIEGKMGIEAAAELNLKLTFNLFTFYKKKNSENKKSQ